MLGGVKIEQIKNHRLFKIIKFFSWLIIIIYIFSGSLHSILFYPGPDSAEAASTWTQSSYWDFYNGTFNNTTIIGSGDSVKLKIDSLKLNEWTNINPVNSPTNRFGHAMASIYGTDKIIIFGGYDRQNYFDETWIYDLSDNTWYQKLTVNKPVARYATIMAQIYGDDKVVLFGGYRFSEIACNDTWVYDLSENSWTQKSPPNSPSLRIGSGMENIYGTDQVLLFGGQGWTDLNDTWIYDLSDDTWTQQINLLVGMDL